MITRSCRYVEEDECNETEEVDEGDGDGDGEDDDDDDDDVAVMAVDWCWLRSDEDGVVDAEWKQL